MRLVAALAAAPVALALAACPDVTESHGPPWVDGPALPTARAGAGVVALGDQLFVIGGVAADGPTTEVDAIDSDEIAAGAGDGAAWSAAPALPAPASQLQVAGFGTRVFALGGLDADGNALGTAYQLDTSLEGSAQAWATLQPMLAGTERGGAGVAWVPPKIYLFGGETAAGGSALASVISYDTEGNFWCPDAGDTLACPPDADAPDLPAPRTAAAALFQSDGIFVVAGGLPSPDATAPAADVWWLPPAPIGGPSSWIVKTSMPVPIAGCAYGSVGGRLVCAGGDVACSGSACAYGSAYAYAPAQDGDPSDQPWCLLAALPAPRIGGDGAAIGARLFVAGGAATPGGAASDSLLVYSSGDDPAVDPIPSASDDPYLCPQ